ncbi:sensor histidine kinase [Ferruginibacter sp.]
MQQYPFIFSDDRSWRIKRHVTFWLVWWLFIAFLYSFVGINSATAYWVRLPASLIDSLIFLLAHMFLTYSLIYFVIPRFVIKQKYWKAAIWVGLMFLVAAGISTLLSMTLIIKVKSALGLTYEQPERDFTRQVFMGLMAGLRGGITVAGISCAIKLMKFWYLKEQRNLQLQKENVAAQMQLLKAQVHPHFLFNTLNNIYSYSQETAPRAARLVTGLSDMLRYMLYECDQPLVPLSKEIKLLQDYCSLEKVRYGKNIDIQLSVPENDPSFSIAPLLLLPFVENSFKHGASKMVDGTWISITITLDNNRMKMKVVNSKPLEDDAVHSKPGIGIANAKARLELLYPARYILNITNEPEVFIVNLSLELDKPAAAVATVPVVQKKLLVHEQQ